MSREITTTVSLTAKKGTLNLSRSASPSITLNGSHYSAVVQSIPTTAGGTAISINSNVATYGVAVFVNNDSTNYVEIGVQVSGTFYPVMRLNAGEIALSRLSQSTTLYALANTAAVNLETIVLEN